MPDALARLASASRERVRGARADAARITRAAKLSPPPRPLVLDPRGFDLIAEIKPSSPSAGPLTRDEERTIEACTRRAARYTEAGACAISVLTEPTAFGGSLELLETIARAITHPVMRKDVLVDPLQIVETRAAGASGVLLVTRVLEDGVLAEMLATASELGLFALVESFDRQDFERAVAAAEAAAGAALIGINARDLATLGLDLARFDALSAHLPSTLPVIAESGLATPAAAEHVASLGFRGALVGEALMREADPRPRLAAMLDAGRRAAAHGETTR